MSEDQSMETLPSNTSKCFHRVRARLYLSLAPCHLENPLQGLRQQHLDQLIMTYNSTLQGVIITYENVRLAKCNDTVAKVANENPFTFLWVIADFIVWKPKIEDVLKGNIVMQSQSHIALLVHDVFNASIKKHYIPQDWSFVPNQADTEENFKNLGYWCDSEGTPISGPLEFTVRAVHVNGKGIAIEGTLLSPEDEYDALPVVMPTTKQHVVFNDNEAVNDDAMDVDEEKLPEIEISEKATSADTDDVPQYAKSESDSDSDSNSTSGSSSDSDSDSSSEDASSSD